MSMTNLEVVEKISQYLSVEEEILWADKPSRLPYSMSITIALIFITFGFFFVALPLYALFTGDSSYLIAMNYNVNGRDLTATSSQGDIELMLMIGLIVIGLNAVLVAAYFMFIFSEKYVVSNQRVLIFSGVLEKRYSSIDPTLVPSIEVTGSETFGSIRFVYSPKGFFSWLAYFYRLRLDSFLFIKNPKQVEKLVREQFLN